MRKTSKKGFTIVELVIVIAIIAILAAILIPTFANVISDARNSAAVAGASGAVSEYLAADPETEYNDFIYDYDSGKVVVYKDGERINKDDSDEVKFYASVDAALTEVFGITDNAETPDVNELEAAKKPATYKDENGETKTIKKLYVVG